MKDKLPTSCSEKPDFTSNLLKVEMCCKNTLHFTCMPDNISISLFPWGVLCLWSLGDLTNITFS